MANIKDGFAKYQGHGVNSPPFHPMKIAYSFLFQGLKFRRAFKYYILN